MAIKLKNVNDIDNTEWLELRKIGIGGSDAAAIAGLNPWKSPFSVYLEKTSDGVKEIPDNERMRVGRDLEDYVARRFEEATGKKVRRNNFMLQSEEYPFMTANVDREVVGENAVLECKTTSSYNRKEWEEGIPIHYHMQVLHYMLVGGYNKGYIACLIGNEAFIWHEVERDEETLKYLIEIESRFWDNLQKGIIPNPDGSDDYDNALKEKFSRSIEDEIMLDIEEDRFIHLERLKEIKKETEAKIKLIEQEVKLSLGEYEKGFKGSYQATWKPQVRTSIDTSRLKNEQPEIAEKYSKTSETRVLRIKEIKE